jgi:hypothetical protein
METILIAFAILITSDIRDKLNWRIGSSVYDKSSGVFLFFDILLPAKTTVGTDCFKILFWNVSRM